MAEVDYSQMDGVSVLWHMISTGDPGFMFIVGLGVFFLIVSVVSDRYIDKDTEKQINKNHRDYGQY